MKVLKINGYEYYEMPENTSTLEEVLELFDQNFNKFLKLGAWEEEECVAPYFVENCRKEVAINISRIWSVELAEIHVFSEEEYMKRLEKCIKEKCIHCECYEGEGTWESHRDKLSLDGKCFHFTKKSDE